MELSEEIIDQAYRAEAEAFSALAQQEDKIRDMKREIEEFKEGSASRLKLEAQITAEGDRATELFRELKEARDHLAHIRDVMAFRSLTK